MKAKAEFKNASWTKFAKPFAGSVLALTLPLSYAAPGDVDLSFDPGSSVNGAVNAIAVQSDRKLMIGGSFTSVHGAMRSCLARLNSDGSTDPSFPSDLGLVGKYYSTPVVNCVALQDDGRILIGSAFISTNGIARTNIARLNPDGSVDDSFMTQEIGRAHV